MHPSAQVAINARAAIRGEIGGVERYARELVARLPALAPGRYRVIAPPPALAHRAGHVWEQAALPLAARGASLIYSPANLAPVLSRDNVVVIHDVAALAHPEAYSKTYVAYQRALLPAIARRARAVITVSEFSKREIIERLRVRPDRVAVIPGGVGGRFSPDADAERATRSLAITRPYVLVVGTTSARKNHAALAPVARALGDHGADLLLAGSDRGYLRSADAGLRRLGYVSEDDLPGLYRGALALVMPSLYEGFGLPCLEAMASGTPVVAADAGALPETCGDAALLVDPWDADALVDATLIAANDAAERARLIEAGHRRAEDFSWERSARETDAVIERVLAER